MVFFYQAAVCQEASVRALGAGSGGGPAPQPALGAFSLRLP